MKILIVDDSIPKLAEVTTLIRSVSNSFIVDSCVDCISALQKLTSKYDLIILDILLPMRASENPDNGAAKFIIDRIYRDTRLKPPTYILCLTQFEEYLDDIHPIWRVIRYDPTSIIWKEAIREILVYISRQYSSDDRIIIDKMPTIFVEGRNDDFIISEALRLYFPDAAKNIKIKSEVGAGADWVTRQLVIWSHSLPRSEDNEYIKSVGIYDNDAKGKEAIEEFKRSISVNSAEYQCVNIFKYSASDARHLIPIYKKGISLPIAIEEMFEYMHWKKAFESAWLENRNNIDMLLKDPSNWDKMTMSLKQHINSIGLTVEEELYLMRFTNKYKDSFRKYILGLEEPDRKKALKCFQPFLAKIVDVLLPKKENS